MTAPLGKRRGGEKQAEPMPNWSHAFTRQGLLQVLPLSPDFA